MPPHTMSELLVQVELLTAEIAKLKEENSSLKFTNKCLDNLLGMEERKSNRIAEESRMYRDQLRRVREIIN